MKHESDTQGTNFILALAQCAKCNMELAKQDVAMLNKLENSL